jgi:diguanylate cyclase (GGDEF)-like protein
LRVGVLKTTIFMVCVIFSNIAHSGDTFSAALKAEIEKIKDNPRQIIEKYEVVIASETDSPLSDKEIFYLLAQAYYAQLLPEQTLKYAVKAFDIVKDEPDTWWHNVINVDLSLAFELNGQASTAQRYAKRALDWAQENKHYVLLQKAYLAQGLNQITLGQYDNALKSFTNAYLMSSQYPGTLPTGHIAYYIALAHEYSNNNGDAIEFFEQATKYYKQSNQIVDYSDALYSLARVHKMIGNYEKALALFTESMEISISLGDIQGQAYTFKELSGIYLSQDETTKAHSSLIKSLKMFSKANNIYMLAEVHTKLAEIANNQQAIAQALYLTKIAISFTQGESLKPQYISLLALQAELLAKSKQYKQAFESSRLALNEQQEHSSRSSKENYERSRAELNLLRSENENQYLALENDKVITELQTEQQQTYLLVLVVVLLITISIAAVILYLQSKIAQQKLSSLANTDPLTKLANRRCAFNTLSTQLKLARRENYELAIALVDLDFFKKINDKYGHPAGDQILLGFANLASQMFRESDTIARIGGEEFLFIFPYTRVDQAQDLIIEFTEKLRFSEAVTTAINEALTCSVGITNPLLYKNGQEAISIADKAMYRAKNIGRDAIVIDTELLPK